MADILPTNFPIPSSDLLPTVDYFTSFTGVGYVNLYMAGSTATGGDAYFLTTDSSIRSDESNYTIAGATSLDVDFDLEIKKPFTLASGKAIMTSHIQVDSGDSHAFTYTLYHVDSGDNETQVGQTVGETKSGGAGAEHFYETVQISTSRKLFNKGEKFRLNITATLAAGSAIFFDPATSYPTTEGSITYSDASKVLIPVEVDI